MRKLHREAAARRAAGRAVTDQFGDERYVRGALLKMGREIELVQMPRAEADPAVAAPTGLQLRRISS